ncbi:MAG: undecaprenyl-diphosphate phosphatase [Firmicutes bacterium]|nr:undecaprenyl-diphosphate phosphatase [Bacillota bacterium]MCM1402040.1 undecaprenyl-diphosphate phosphatase [Bacteroides sp.]MCM1476783.1 undecaprenyl-diphosphate phosphatase [Bacteroides sp.]
MSWLDALILGIVQGLSEYLPISSSGHLEIFRSILGIDLAGDEALELVVALHVATVLSTIVVLWREFWPLCTSFFTFKRDANTLYVLKILVSCIPIAIVGLCFKDFVDNLFGGSLTIVGCCLLITAALLAFAYYFRGRSNSATTYSAAPLLPREHSISFRDAFIIGCAQAVATLPGLSRSGSTIATGLLLGDRRSEIAQFSFFMVIIPILGEALLDTVHIIDGTSAANSIGLVPLLVGFLAAFIVGCIACKWMIEIVKRGKLIWFALYCVIMGVVCLVW